MKCLKIDEDAADELVVQVLLEDCENLKKDAKKIKKDKKGFIFSTDYKEDLEEVNKLIDAYTEVLKYYGVKS